MSQLVGFAGDDDFCLRGSIYPNPKDQTLFWSLENPVDLYFPPTKRARLSAPFAFTGEKSAPKKQASIEILPDECLFEIFRRLSGGEERSACACVSRRWLSLVSNMSRDELSQTSQVAKSEAADLEIEGDGYLSRSLEGKKATDTRLAAIAVGTATRGGLGKLSIRGSSGVTRVGLKAISRGCPSLKALSLWNLPKVGDEALIEIANGCHMLEKIDLCGCPGISSKGLVALAKNCPKLTEITIESCSNLANEGLLAVGQYCPNLKSVSVKNCPVVGDQGIAGLVSSPSCAIKKLKLQSLNITDVSLAVIGHYGKDITDLSLTNLPNVTERGFWVMGNAHNLQKLKSFSVVSCKGITDAGVEAVGKGCPNLRQFCLKKSAFLSDCGLVAFVKASASLESLQLEECYRITQLGLFSSLLKSGAQLKTLALVNCLGYRDLDLKVPDFSSCGSIRSLTIRNCPGFGDSSLSLLGKVCPKLQNLEISGLQGVTDSGFIPLLENSSAGLVKVNLSGCPNFSDKVVSVLTAQHGLTLEALTLEGCGKITDASLAAIAKNCFLLRDLDVSKCAVSDFGISALSGSNQVNLQVFSVSGCSMVSDKSVSGFLKMGKTLQGLNLQHCNGISSSSIDLLIERLWRCDILY